MNAPAETIENMIIIGSGPPVFIVHNIQLTGVNAIQYFVMVTPGDQANAVRLYRLYLLNNV